MLTFFYGHANIPHHFYTTHACFLVSGSKSFMDYSCCSPYLFSKKRNRQISCWLLGVVIWELLLLPRPILADAKQRPRAQAKSLVFDLTINNIEPSDLANERLSLRLFEKDIIVEEITKTVSESSSSLYIITAYNSSMSQCDASPCITASGFNVCKHNIEDTVAANFLPLGTKIKIPDLFGEQIFVVRDRMHPRHHNQIDVWMKEYKKAKQFGVKVARIEIISF